MQTTDRKPIASLQALLANSLDYAGLFPPANLSLDTAIKNYAAYRLGLDAWFLGQFVCPVNRLSELGSYIPLFAKSAPLAISALALPAPTWKELVEKLRESLNLMFRFQRAHAPRVRIDSLEIALPNDLTAAVGRLEIFDLVPAMAQAIELSGLPPLKPYFEVTAPDWQAQDHFTIRAIAKHNAGWRGERCRRAAFKLRTGGVKAEAVPSVERVAFVMQTCRTNGVACKCTAGLHHPVRHYDDSIAAKMHGFLNVFAGSVLLHARSLEPSNLPLVLEDEKNCYFFFREDCLSWKGYRASLDDISAARGDLIVSFGSCSFEEPLEDLRELRIL